jgi:hypothetical protein
MARQGNDRPAAADRVRIMDVVWAVESAQREVMAPEKSIWPVLVI